MNMSVPESLFFMDLPDLRELCAVKIFLTPNPCIRDTQIKLCRHLLFFYDQIVASPDPEEFDKITVIMANSFYKTRKVQSFVEKQSSKIESPEKVTTTQLQACLSYTLATHLAPHWNKVGHLLIKGSDFLAKSGKLEAVNMCLNVSDTQICICIQVQKVQLPPCELSDFNIAVGTLQRFFNSPGVIIPSHFITSNWCYVLPSMKMGQIISISHDIPTDSPFKSYKDFQVHWNALYGYELPSESEKDVIYCNVYFKLVGEKLFTYPLICLRSQPIQFYPQSEMATVLDAFICDLKCKMSHLCGFPVMISEKPVYTAKELTRPLSQGNPCLVNLTAKFSSGSQFHDSRYNAEIDQKMVPMKQTSQEQLSEKLCLPQAARTPVNTIPFISPSQPFLFRSSSSSMIYQENMLTYVPVFQKKTIKVNANKFHNLQTKVCVINQSVHITSSGNALNKATGAMQHPSSSIIRKTQLPAALHLTENRLVSSVNSAEPLEGHSSDTCEINGIKMENTNSLHKRKKPENNGQSAFVPITAKCLTPDVSAKEEWFDLNYKKCRTKHTVKEVDVEKNARINELYKMNNSTLQNWLKERRVSTKSRDRKEQLVAKIMQFLQEP